MSNRSTVLMYLDSVRAVGSKDSQGVAHGGIYYPAHFKNGNQVSARWEGIVAENRPGWTDEAGNYHDSDPTYYRLVVWNGKNAAAGKGLADKFAKYVSVGKAISCEVQPKSFRKRIFINGQPLVGPDGNIVETDSMNFKIIGKLTFGDDAAKQVDAEIARFNPQAPTVDSRPLSWNIAGTPDNEVWKQIVAAKDAMVYDGQSPTFGYARIIITEGGQAVNPNMNTTTVTTNQGINQPINQPMTGMAPATAGQIITNQQANMTAPVNGSVPIL